MLRSRISSLQISIERQICSALTAGKRIRTISPERFRIYAATEAVLDEMRLSESGMTAMEETWHEK